MRFTRQFARAAGGLTCLLLLATSARSQQAPVLQEPIAHAEMNFAELARQQAMQPAILPDNEQETDIGPPLPIPRRTLPAETIAKLQHAGSLAKALSSTREFSLTPIVEIPSPSLLTSFLGLDGNNTGKLPPDTNGAVGPNHIWLP